MSSIMAFRSESGSGRGRSSVFLTRRSFVSRLGKAGAPALLVLLALISSHLSFRPHSSASSAHGHASASQNQPHLFQELSTPGHGQFLRVWHLETNPVGTRR